MEDRWVSSLEMEGYVAPESVQSSMTSSGSPPAAPTTLPFATLEKQLLRRAARHFRQKEYGEAANDYFEVISSRPEDVRLSHNLAIAQFYQNHLRDTDGFLHQFFSVLSQAKGDPGANYTLTDKEIATLHPVFLYNLAVIYFQDSQPWKSLEIAITLLQHLCSNDPGCALAMNTRLLIAELYFTLQKYELALEVVTATAQLCDGIRTSPLEAAGVSMTPRLTEVDGMKHNVRVKMKELKALSLLSRHSVSLGREEYKEFRNLSSTCTADDPRRVGVQFLKAFHNYLGGNIRKALMIMSSIGVNESDDFFLRTGDNGLMMVKNNIGCCHYSTGKPTVAAWYFQKASQESNKADFKDRETLPFHCLGSNKKYEIMYNFGVSLLNAKKSVEAFNVLTRCQSVFPTNPRLWLRVAECCVQLHKSTNSEDFAWTEEKRNIFMGIESLNKCEPGLRPVTIDLNKPDPSLLYARHCIAMAIPLATSQRVDVGPSNPLTEISEMDVLRANIFCLGAYINLTLGNYTEAAQLTRNLLAIPAIPNVFEYLGKLYWYEALFRSGRLRCVQDLFPEQCVPTYSLNLTMFTGYSNTDGKIPRDIHRILSPSTFKPATEWTPRDDMSAKTTMMYNRAVGLTLVGEFEMAMSLVNDWMGMIGYNEPIPPDFILLSIHLNLKSGNIQKASDLYRQHCPPLKSQCPSGLPLPSSST